MSKNKKIDESKMVATNINIPLHIRNSAALNSAFVLSRFKNRTGFLSAALKTFKQLIDKFGPAEAVYEMERRIDQ